MKKEIISYIIIILSVIIIRSFVVTPVVVKGSSMTETLYDGDVLILNKLNFGYDLFDVVVLEYNNSLLVKRIIGFSGDHVKYVDGDLYINNELVEENFITDVTLDFDITQLGFNVIPDGYYFVMGDNRDNSTDSRTIGFIKEEDILGTVSLRIYPLNEISFVK
ncbi:MAG: signal peptidase I [Mycoplasmatota bacterium]